MGHFNVIWGFVKPSEGSSSADNAFICLYISKMKHGIYIGLINTQIIYIYTNIKHSKTAYLLYTASVMARVIYKLI